MIPLFSTSVSRIFRSVCVALTTLVLLTACETPSRTVPLNTIGDARIPQKVLGGPVAGERLLMMMSASGGGTRAAALTLGTLKGLASATFPNAVTVNQSDANASSDMPVSMAEELDILSSVSGGSLTTAYFALKGKQGFETLEQDFLLKPGISAFVKRFFNPMNLLETATNARSRLDVAIDYYNDTLFSGATFADIQHRRPYIIVNAADMVRGSVFEFTQSQFDLLCADLDAFSLAQAAAASSAFPIILSPLTLRNYSPCPHQIDGLDLRRGAFGKWPPEWIARGNSLSDNTAIDTVRRARVGDSYLNLNCEFARGQAQSCAPKQQLDMRPWVHLLDGGIADNLGTTALIRRMVEDGSETLINAIFNDARVENLLFIVVNAQGVAENNLDKSGDTPGVVSMFNAVTGTSINGASYSNLARMDDVMNQIIKDQLGDVPLCGADAKGPCPSTLIVDFEKIADRQCREAFQHISTSWTLPHSQVKGLIELGEALVVGSKSFQTLAKAYGATIQSDASLDRACSMVLPE